MRRLLFLPAAAMAAWALSASPARADEAIWSAAGMTVLRLHGVKGATAQQRVEELEGRVTEVLSAGDGTVAVSDIALKSSKDAVWIAVKDKLLVTVAAEDADANHMTRQRLGRIWLANLHKVLPQLAPRENKKGA